VAVNVLAPAREAAVTEFMAEFSASTLDHFGFQQSIRFKTGQLFQPPSVWGVIGV